MVALAYRWRTAERRRTGLTTVGPCLTTGLLSLLPRSENTSSTRDGMSYNGSAPQGRVVGFRLAQQTAGLATDYRHASIVACISEATGHAPDENKGRAITAFAGVVERNFRRTRCGCGREKLRSASSKILELIRTISPKLSITACCHSNCHLAIPTVWLDQRLRRRTVSTAANSD